MNIRNEYPTITNGRLITYTRLLHKYGKKELEKLIVDLEALPKNKNRIQNINYGLCYYITHRQTHSPVRGTYIVNSLSRYWPKYSGDLIYPVPSPANSRLSPHKAYSTIINLWDRRTQYGRDRYELAAFILEELRVIVKYADELSNLYIVHRQTTNH